MTENGNSPAKELITVSKETDSPLLSADLPWDEFKKMIYN